MSQMIKMVYFDKGKTYSKTKIEFFPSELMRYFKKTTTQKITGSGKNKKIEVVEDNDNLECIKDCILNYSISTNDEN